MSEMMGWATDAFNLVLERFDRLCDALERVADSLEGKEADDVVPD
jgi:hypothetical protein